MKKTQRGLRESGAGGSRPCRTPVRRPLAHTCPRPVRVREQERQRGTEKKEREATGEKREENTAVRDH